MSRTIVRAACLMFGSVAFCAVMMCAEAALAWNKAGHMTTGAIAYNHLTVIDSTAAAAVLTILESHPDYDDWTHQIDHLPDAVQERILFMFAARWPDDARGTSEDHPTWHYINYPFALDGTTVPSGPPTGQEDLFFAYRANLQALQTGTDEEKAIALCWLFHLYGDAHQPLHSVEMFDAAFPHGDNGGTKCYIKATAGASSISLHKFWDGLVQGSEKTRDVAIKARVIASEYPAATLGELESSFTDTDFATKWVETESLGLAKSGVYRFGGNAIAISATKPGATALPAGYTPAAEPLAHKRAALAGYRLAILLKDKF